MTGAGIFGGIILTGLLSLTAAAQGGAQPKPPRAPQSQAQRNHPGQGQGYRAAIWLRAHHNLTPEQQEKALESDPGFKKLPPERQAELKNNLRQFNSLPQPQRERALRRWEYLETLSPQQREQLRQANRELKALPDGRELALHRALRALRQMTPEHREEVYKTDRFRNTFSGQEQDILKRLAAMSPPEEPGK